MHNKITRILLLAVIIAGTTLVVIFREAIDATALEAWVKDAGAVGPILFMLIYALGTVFFLPGSIITLLGGALFGPVLGTCYNLTGATLGATLAFLVARIDWVVLLEQRMRLRYLKQASAAVSENWKRTWVCNCLSENATT